MIMRLSNMRVRSGFTLAEVLITLGIIGVVAAMTMPTLMNSTQGAQYKAAYKKALSALSQAVTLNVALDEWSLADLESNAAGTYGLKTMLKSRMNVVRDAEEKAFKDAKGDSYSVKVGSGKGIGVATVSAPGTNNVTLFFNDGIMFTFPKDVKSCTIGTDEGLNDTNRATLITNKCTGFIDVNGIKAPNRIVQCDGGTGTADSCDIKSPTDVYPVIFYDQTILPNSVAARAVLYSK